VEKNIDRAITRVRKGNKLMRTGYVKKTFREEKDQYKELD